MHSGLVINEDGDVLMTGWRGNDSWLVKTDSIGNVLWHQTYPQLSPGGDGGTRVVKLNDGNFAILGGSANSSTGTSDGYILKVDQIGDPIWTKKYIPTHGSQSLWWGQVLADGTIVAAGQTTNTDDDSQAGWLIKTDANGDTLWTRTFNPSSLIDRFLNMLVMPNGDIVMVGSGRDEGEIIQYGWILRVDSMGCLAENCFSVGIEEQPFGSAQGRLEVYPNPAITEVTLSLGSADLQDAEIVITDMLGRVMCSGGDCFTHSGEFAMTGTGVVDISTWPIGLYICSLYSHQRLLQTSRLVRMK